MQHLALPLRPLWHMGPLHPVEQLLTLALAFGPFLVLGIVIWRRQRSLAAQDQEQDQDRDQDQGAAVSEGDPDVQEPPSRTAPGADRVSD